MIVSTEMWFGIDTVRDRRFATSSSVSRPRAARRCARMWGDAVTTMTRMVGKRSAASTMTLRDTLATTVLAARKIIDDVGRDAVVQAVGLPLQREGSGGEGGFGDGLVVFTSGLGGAGDGAADETNPGIVGKRCAGHTKQGVFAGAAGSDNENKHAEPH